MAVVNINEEPVSQGEVVGAETSQEPAENELPEHRVARIAVYNGGGIKNLAADLANEVATLERVEIISKDNASALYAKTLVVDLIGTNADVVKEIAEKIGGEVGDLPSGEVRPDADILIIGGKNQKTTQE